MKFIKMQALGNDYIYLDCIKTVPPENPASLAVSLSKRRFCIGADGLVLILPSHIADVRMRIFNADGSEAEICGNALRCIAKYAFEKNYCKSDEIAIETACGVKTVSRVNNEFSVKMGKAVITGENPFTVDMGNPHMVVFTDDVDAFDFNSYGFFDPVHYNTEAVQLTEDGLKMRVYERGSGETLACGSGACAAAAAAVCAGLKQFGGIKVFLPGGVLKVTVNDNYEITLCGNADIVYYGEVYLD